MKLQVIIGTVREGRVTDRLGKWVAAEAKNLPDTTVEIVDLLDYPMPFFDEAVSPRYNPERKPKPEVKKWLDKLAEADAYAFVTPEYNRSIAGVLKNAIDYFAYEIDKKPILLVAHGSTGGAQAVANLRMALPGVGAITVPQAVFMTDRVSESISEDGELSAEIKARPFSPQDNLKTALTTLKWYSDALASARSQEA